MEIPDIMRRNRKAFRMLLTNYLLDFGDEDDKTTDFFVLHDLLFPVVTLKSEN